MRAAFPTRKQPAPEENVSELEYLTTTPVVYGNFVDQQLTLIRFDKMASDFEFTAE